MRTCAKCGNHFPIRAKIDGKVRNLQSRKYCLVCSPFGQHNTSKLNKKNNFISLKELPTEKICSKCEQKLSIVDFGVHKRKRDQKYFIFSYCKKCDSGRLIAKKRQIKQKAVKYKGGRCEICGYRRSLRSLHFHHKDPQKKEFAISRMTKISESKLKAELDKCVLLCGNCHGEVHEEIDGESTKVTAAWRYLKEGKVYRPQLNPTEEGILFFKNENVALRFYLSLHDPDLVDVCFVAGDLSKWEMQPVKIEYNFKNGKVDAATYDAIIASPKHIYDFSFCFLKANPQQIHLVNVSCDDVAIISCLVGDQVVFHVTDENRTYLQMR